MNEVSAFLHLFCGGGDVKFNRIKTLAKQREILLTAGDGNVVEKIDLAGLGRDGASPLMLLQPAYLCSSTNVVIKSVPCDASLMSWARAPYVYEARPTNEMFKPAILCLAGRTMVWSERLQPGESRDFALGNVIAATANISSTLRPTSQCHPDDHRASIAQDSHRQTQNYESAVELKRKRGIGATFRSFVAASKVFFESIRAREGVLVCEMTNHSDSPAYVFVQLNKSSFYGGSGFLGFVTNIISYFIRLSHLPLGG
jgi:hypothetical protein